MSKDSGHYNPDHPRPIPVDNDYRSSPTQRLPLSWGEATKLFFRDNKANLAKKVAARYAPAAFAAFGIADDALLPVIGAADEPLTALFLGWCVWRINKYRKTGK